MRNALKDERGTTQVEYGLLALLVAITAILLLAVIAFDVLELFDVVENQTGSLLDGPELPAPPVGEDDAL